MSSLTCIVYAKLNLQIKVSLNKKTVYINIFTNFVLISFFHSVLNYIPILGCKHMFFTCFKKICIAAVLLKLKFLKNLKWRPRWWTCCENTVAIAIGLN